MSQVRPNEHSYGIDGPFSSLISLLKVVMFHSYVSVLKEGYIVMGMALDMNLYLHIFSPLLFAKVSLFNPPEALLLGFWHVFSGL